MEIGFDIKTLITGVLILLARTADVTMGTLRTISIIRGKSRTAFFLGFIEVSIWLVVIAAVLNEVINKPILGIFYALGFSMGNVVGILIERQISSGNVVLRVISPRNGRKLAQTIRQYGYGVTTFDGEGLSGPVTMLYIVCMKKDMENLITEIKRIVPDAFYIIEQGGSVSKIQRPFVQTPTGWRAILKKK